MAGSLKIGLISNPRSNANQRQGGIGSQVSPEPSVLVAQPASHDELKLELLRFAREGVDLIAIDGGDGTIRDVLTYIDHAYPNDWPYFVLLPSGKTNVVAAHVGSFGTGVHGWRNLLTARQAGTLTKVIVETPALEVRWPAQKERVLRGFLLGCAAFTDGVELANEKIHPKGIAKSLAVALVIGGILKRVLTRKAEDGKETAKKGQVIVDGTAVNGDRHLLFMASTIHRLTLGIKPFRKAGAGNLLWLDISNNVRHLAYGGMMVVLGKYKKWMLEGGYASGAAHEIDLQFNSPFIMDGDAFDPCGQVTIVASRRIRFVGK